MLIRNRHAKAKPGSYFYQSNLSAVPQSPVTMPRSAIAGSESQIRPGCLLTKASEEL